MTTIYAVLSVLLGVHLDEVRVGECFQDTEETYSLRHWVMRVHTCTGTVIVPICLKFSVRVLCFQARLASLSPWESFPFFRCSLSSLLACSAGPYTSSLCLVILFAAVPWDSVAWASCCDLASVVQFLAAVFYITSACVLLFAGAFAFVRLTPEQAWTGS